jgi:hypothetical protein
MSTHVSVIGSNGDTVLQNSGIIDFIGKSPGDPCFIRNARLLPQTITNSAPLSVLNLDLKVNNNFHIDTSTSIGRINLQEVIKGQSGHIIINNLNNNDHSEIIWQINGNPSYIKWQGGNAPILSSTSGYVDLISYYVYNETCVLMVPSVAYFY